MSPNPYQVLIPQTAKGSASNPFFKTVLLFIIRKAHDFITAES